MRRALQISATVTALLFTTTLFAQRGTNGGGNSHAGGGGHSAAAMSGGGGWHQQRQAPQQQTFHRSLGAGVTPGYVSPFNQEIHIVTPGMGCYGCGYGVYGGYAYGGYDGGGYGGYYGSGNPDGYPTATDQILANGGVWPSSAQTQQQAPAPQTAPSTDVYIHHDYPVQYNAMSDNNPANANAVQQTQMVSAASSTPAILVFKDGTNLTIENYAIYGAYIIVITPQQRKFPIAALDIPATEKANDAAGYELHLPAVFTGK